MKAIGIIYLAWRKGKGSRRKIVGRIKKNSSNGVSFSYIKKGVEEASGEGFTPYIDFPDIDKVYTENVIETFGQRLIKNERTDIQKYLDFWAIDSKYQDDKYYLLAHTQGMLSNDNFEFLADFYPVKELCFISEICGLSQAKIAPGILSVGDKLTYKLDKSNLYDKFAVRVFKDELPIGYIKLIHSRIFYKNLKSELKISVKSIDQNGSVNRVFVSVSF